MGRKKVYSSAAERQRACRERRNSAPDPVIVVKEPVPAPPETPESRPARLAKLRGEMTTLLADYEQWTKRVPLTLAKTGDGGTLEKLRKVADLMAKIRLPEDSGYYEEPASS